MASVLKVDTIQHTDGTSAVAAKVNESRQCVMGFMLTSGLGASQTPITGWVDMATQLSSEQVGKITRGGSVTESSGVFSFPFTGLWQIEFYGSANSTGGDPTIEYNIRASVNAGGTFSNIAQAKESHSASGYKASASLKTLFNCANTTNHVIDFQQTSFGNSTSEGDTGLSLIHI